MPVPVHAIEGWNLGAGVARRAHDRSAKCCGPGIVLDASDRTRLTMPRAQQRTFGLVYGAAAAGGAVDRDEHGGNPFATSLIELAGEPGLKLRQLPSKLRRLTAGRTAGIQVPEGKVQPTRPNRQFTLDEGARHERTAAPKRASRSAPRGGSSCERRAALVLIVPQDRAIPISRIVAASRARHVNLVFFAGCRQRVGQGGS